MGSNSLGAGLAMVGEGRNVVSGHLDPGTCGGGREAGCEAARRADGSRAGELAVCTAVPAPRRDGR